MNIYPALLVVFLLCFSQSVELTKDGLNVLTRENLEYCLSQNNTVLALWNSQNCISCASTMWDVYLTLYAYFNEKRFFVMAATIGKDEGLDLQYGIDVIEDGTSFRLFIGGSQEAVAKDDSDDLITWVAKQTHYVPQPDCVSVITPDTYDSFMKRNAHRSVLVMYYLPNYQPAQITAVQYERAALAFKIEPKVAFARLDCTGHTEFCQNKGVDKIPRFIFTPGPDVEFDGNQLETTRGEGIVLYLNKILHTTVDQKGGMNERYGREYELDRLARQFILNNNEAQRSRLVKETAKLRKRYRATAKYYKIMKGIQKEGPTTIMRELKVVKDNLAQLTFDDPEYLQYRQRENIIHQFEAINTRYQLVHMNPWSFDYVVNGIDNVVVLFYTSWCVECKGLMDDMESELMAKEMKYDVVVASMDAQMYVDFCAPFHLNHFPGIKWFGAGKDTMEPENIPANTRGQIEAFIKSKFEEEEL